MVRETVPSQQQQHRATCNRIKTTVSSPLEKFASDGLNQNGDLSHSGPASELCDVVYFPISHASGLHLVHPTWAGTFVLAALCLVFPGLHIVLLDSDCAPVTLFEVEDLKIYGKKHSVYSMVGSLVRFQPAVGLGA